VIPVFWFYGKIAINPLLGELSSLLMGDGECCSSLFNYMKKEIIHRQKFNVGSVSYITLMQ